MLLFNEFKREKLPFKIKKVTKKFHSTTNNKIENISKLKKKKKSERRWWKRNEKKTSKDGWCVMDESENNM